MRTIRSKLERAEERTTLGGGWYLSSAAPIMEQTERREHGLLPSDLVYYRGRHSVVIRVNGRQVLLDKPLVVSKPQRNARPSVYLWVVE